LFVYLDDILITFNPFPYPVARGRPSRWTSSPSSHGNTTVLTIVDRFPKLSTLSLNQNYLQPRKSLSFSPSMFSVSPRILFWTEAHGLSPRFGKRSVTLWGQLSVCPLDTTPSSMVKLSVQTRVWKPPSDASPHLTPPPGVHSYHGL